MSLKYFLYINNKTKQLFQMSKRVILIQLRTVCYHLVYFIHSLIFKKFIKCNSCLPLYCMFNKILNLE